MFRRLHGPGRGLTTTSRTAGSPPALPEAATGSIYAGAVAVARSIVLFVLAAYGGVFVAGSLLWGVALDGFRPDRWDLIGALICLVGVVVIMYAPRPA